MSVQDLFDLPTEITLYLQHDSADALFWIVCFVRQNLLSVREHAAGTLSATHGPQRRDTRILRVMTSCPDQLPSSALPRCAICADCATCGSPGRATAFSSERN